MRLKRWQLAGALAILIMAACAPGWAQTSTPAPETDPTQTQKPKLEIRIPETHVPGSIVETVTAIQSLNVRQFPTEGSTSLDVLLHGEQVVFTGICSESPRGWAQIEHKDGTSGLAWVKSRYISGEHCKEE